MLPTNKSQLNSPVQFLSNQKWWQKSASISAQFARYCLLPAFLLAFANISLLVGLNAMGNVSSLAAESIESLTQRLVIGGISSIFGIVVTLWALTAWLNRLTAFSNVFIQCRTSDSPVTSQINQALSETKRKGKALFKYWLWVSLYLLVPAIPLTGLVLFQEFTSSPELTSIAAIPIPAWVLTLVMSLEIVLVIVILAFTFSAMAVSAKLNSGGHSEAQQSLKLFFDNWLVLCLMGAVVLAVNTVVSAPQILIGSAPIVTTKVDLFWGSVQQIWLAVTSSFLWTFSFAPALEYLPRLKTSSS